MLLLPRTLLDARKVRKRKKRSRKVTEGTKAAYSKEKRKKKIQRYRIKGPPPRSRCLKINVPLVPVIPIDHDLDALTFRLSLL